jgi:cell division protease FtsH
VRRLIDAAHRDVTALLTAHREQLDTLTAALLHAETLDGIDAYRAAELPMHAEPPVTPDPGLRSVSFAARP